MTVTSRRSGVGGPRRAHRHGHWSRRHRRTTAAALTSERLHVYRCFNLLSVGVDEADGLRDARQELLSRAVHVGLHVVDFVSGDIIIVVVVLLDPPVEFIVRRVGVRRVSCGRDASICFKLFDAFLVHSGPFVAFEIGACLESFVAQCAVVGSFT